MIRQVLPLFFFGGGYYYKLWSSLWDSVVSLYLKSQGSLCISFSWTASVCAYSICSYGQIPISCSVPYLPSRVKSYIFLCEFASFAYMSDRFVCLWFEIPIQLLFLPFLFSSYCCFVNLFIVFVVSGRCSRSFFALFYIVFVLSYWCIDAIFNADKSFSSFFSWHILLLLEFFISR